MPPAATAPTTAVDDAAAMMTISAIRRAVWEEETLRTSTSRPSPSTPASNPPPALRQPKLTPPPRSREANGKRERSPLSNTKKTANANTTNYGANFTPDEISAESRRPKRKVAVMIGYAGTGYKGMQITPEHRTIEGDLFQAFIKAGAISKANADDPKKAGLVRCARTDKGVHAAGNMISLKLIVEDEDIVEKINSELDPQIRVWGIERTIGSFSCYQACDSRWYEYLIPSHAFLPPHPSSWLAKQMVKWAEEKGDTEEYEGRQEEVKGFWEEFDRRVVDKIVEGIDEDIRHDVIAALQGEDEASVRDGNGAAAAAAVVTEEEAAPDADSGAEKTEDAALVLAEPEKTNSPPLVDTIMADDASTDPTAPAPTTQPQISRTRLDRINVATRLLRTAYLSAKRDYRIPPARLSRIQSALEKFAGTRNYHNYTVEKTFKSKDASRHMKSLKVNPKTILIGEGEQQTEWLSIKIHGQSFMMHQIRKMIGMVALLVRCGADLGTMDVSFGEDKFSIPKVPGLGLLLERPVFDSYNKLTAPKHDRPELKFSKFEKTMEEFKEREIYQRIFREEEQRNEFGKFFNHVDNFKVPTFLFVTSGGLEATKAAVVGGLEKVGEVESGDDEGEGRDDEMVG